MIVSNKQIPNNLSKYNIAITSLLLHANNNKFMSKDHSRKRSELSKRQQSQLRQQNNEILAPIYNKVELLKRQMQDKHQMKQTRNQFFINTCKTVHLDVPVDRNTEIEKLREMHQSQSQSNLMKSRKQNSSSLKRTNSTVNWKGSNRDKTKSLVRFLAQHKSKPVAKTSSPINHSKIKSFAQDGSHIVELDDKFEPVGQEYKKQKLFAQSQKSQTQSLTSSRNDTISLHSSKIGGLVKKDSKKYLRKGTRVREILLRQLQTPQQRSSPGTSPMTYLKQYDQWVPSTLVQQKKQQLQNFMNIIYGGKKVQSSNQVDLDKINIIYL